MPKTPTQEKLEAQQHANIHEIVASALEANRGKKNLTMLVALELEVTQATLYSWCHDLGIDIDSYRNDPTPQFTNGIGGE